MLYKEYLLDGSSPTSNHTYLHHISLKNIGIIQELTVDFNPRLNLFTGDNGLGKTFLLDVIWWVFTHAWLNKPALPQYNTSKPAQISYQLSSNHQLTPIETCQFNFEEQIWPKSDFASGIVIYMQTGGKFALFDSTRTINELAFGSLMLSKKYGYQLEEKDIWNGAKINDAIFCNGLIHDWVTWQYQPEQDENSPFELLKRVMKHLSPHYTEQMTPGKPVRISIDDIRDIPTLNLPYGNVPITHLSAGMKRILSLAYLLVWSWYEHQQAARLRRQPPTQQVILLIDEIETHLHPQWQRAILPAILSVMQAMKQDLAMQIMVTTHSPLVLASVEPHFDEIQDKLFLFNLVEQQIKLEEMPWTKTGDAVNWLTSDIFGLKQARSREAEIAIQAANTLMRGEPLTEFPPYLQTKPQIHEELLRVLPGHDDFWPRWIVTADPL